MRTIRLYGELGNKFGETFTLEVASPAEAVRALCVQLDGFQKYLLDSEKNNIGFKVFDASHLLNEKQLIMHGTGEIKIVPLVGGANGEFRVLVGSALIGAALIANSYIPGNPVSPYLMNAGIALAVGGAIQMIVGPPEAPKIHEKPENTPSYVFSGAVNTTAQGHPVPVGYGRMVVGSAVISAGLSVHSLMAGYVTKTREATIDLISLGSPDSIYVGNVPANYFLRELLETGTKTVTLYSGELSFQSQVTYWKYRYHYYETYMELQTV
ncbi:MAG: tail assembly protein [Pseudobdellovibrionaceae bacterium]